MVTTEEDPRLAVTIDLMVRIEEARESPIGLYKLLFTDEEGRPIIIKWFHEEWNELIMTHPQVMIEASRETTKTSFMLAAILWTIGKNPNIRIKLLTETDEAATKRMSFVHKLVDENPLYHLVFPNVKKDKSPKQPNTKLQFTLVRDFDTPEPTLEARGVMSAGTGGRADLIVMDDVVGASNSVKNPAMIPKVKEKVLTDWLGTLTGKGRVWCIFTPWDANDINAYLKKTAGWVYKKYAHGKPGDPYHSIFPERWPREVLMKRRLWFGPIFYAKLYLCKLISSQASVVLPEHLTPYTMTNLTPSKLARAEALISVDPASGRDLTKRNRGDLDYVGVAVLLFVDNTGFDEPSPYEVFVVEAFRIRLTTRQQPMLLWQLAKQWGATTVIVESHGMQTLSDWLDDNKETDVTKTAEIAPISFGNQPKGQRLLRVTPMLSPPEGHPPIVYFHPKVVVPEPQPDGVILTDGTEHEILRNLREEILGFPAVAHDDIMDVTVQGLIWILVFRVPHVGTEDSDTAPGDAFQFITL